MVAFRYVCAQRIRVKALSKLVCGGVRRVCAPGIGIKALSRRTSIPITVCGLVISSLPLTECARLRLSSLPITECAQLRLSSPPITECD